MSDCYNFTNYIPKNKHNIIEVGYVLTLKNSKNDFKKQLDLFSPSNNLFIVINNKGYKDKNKNLCDKKLYYDLLFSYYTIFKHALKNYPSKNIILYEEDFYWNKKINLLDTFKKINLFIKNKKNFCYNLGCLPIIGLQDVENNDHYLMKLVAGAHTVIYSPDAMKKFVNDYNNNPCFIYCNEKYFCDHTNYYIFNTPLSYQIWPNILEKKEYENMITEILHIDKNKLSNNLTIFSLHSFKLLNLDKSENPGYNFYYNLLKFTNNSLKKTPSFFFKFLYNLLLNTK